MTFTQTPGDDAAHVDLTCDRCRESTRVLRGDTRGAEAWRRVHVCRDETYRAERAGGAA